jgi:hypothetical protein
MSLPAAIKKFGGFAVITMNGQLQCTIEIKGPAAHLVGSGNGYQINYAQCEKEAILKFIKSNLTVKTTSQFLAVHFHNSLQQHLLPKI